MIQRRRGEINIVLYLLHVGISVPLSNLRKFESLTSRSLHQIFFKKAMQVYKESLNKDICTVGDFRRRRYPEKRNTEVLSSGKSTWRRRRGLKPISCVSAPHRNLEAKCVSSLGLSYSLSHHIVSAIA